MEISLSFSDRDIGTLLAALRLYQSRGGAPALPPGMGMLPTNGGACKPLDLPEIDGLIERIKTR